ncbi:sodium-dependent transporter [Kineobactrum salinum]|uniref:Sodium-dependent transporter n=1 Tax=Kineobactrum salinum TaxID=2708301 RepID=A0A6C0TWT7_9GAMM|nr:sodium-dependent transporter [Kineobactrum salinum]QIB64292.1 sodium-dependent transporter [Kineobactrum salinum]
MLRQQFSSSLAAVLTMAGAAIGLGNIWRFPYMMGSYGGSAFLLIYLLFVLLIAVPALTGEWALGRSSRGGTITAFATCYGPRTGRALGYMLVLGMLCSGSYYLVVIGNVALMTWTSFTTGFAGEHQQAFVQQLEHGPTRYLLALAVLAGILWVAYRGLHEGIERVSKLFVPFFFLVIIYLTIQTLGLEGAPEKMRLFLTPDFSQITPTSVFAALGQAVFSVGLGGTIMVIYGSYLSRGASLWRGAIATAGADTSAALLAAMFIFPTILVYGISPAAGPTLLFESLAQLFAQMDNGRILGSFFLLALLLVAFLSGLAALEVVFGSISDDESTHGLNRKRTIIVFGVVEALIMIIPGFNPGAVAIMDLLFGSGMLAVGSALAIIGLTWRLKQVAVVSEFGASKLTDFLFIWLKWVVPAVILAILIISYIH